MGFYGNVINKSEMQYVFDKIYKNRSEMEAALLKGDGVYIGRYVLVSYEYHNEDFDDYEENYRIDYEKYKNARGYDSTVWQKAFINEKEEYVKIDDLNAAMPTFIVVPEAPTEEPIAPYLDWQGTNVYNLHIQPQPSIKIKKATEEESDIKIGEDDVAIYFNKAGFGKEKTNYVEKDDAINLTLTGFSENNKYGETGESAADIQELSIILPSLGNAISDIWDIVYGAGDPDRNLDIQWNSTKGLRLTRNEDGYIYDDSENGAINTLAGCINTTHDLIGMIIVDDIDDINKASIDNIYYGALDENKPNIKGFFIKYPYYTYEVLTQEKYEELLSKAINPVKLKDFTDFKAYIKTNEGYQLDTSGLYRKGTTYYSVEATAIDLDDSYASNKYYYKENFDYLIDSSKIPEKNEYYNVSFTSKININNTYFYNPTAHVSNGENNYTGLFYIDSESNLHKIDGENDPDFDPNNDPSLSVDPSADTNYYFIGVNYSFKPGHDENGRPITIYEFDYGEKIRVKMVQFEENKYYYKEEVAAGKYDYRYLDSIEKVNEKTVYGELTINKIELPFYIPKKYYYKINEDYILGTEEKMQNDKQYLVLNPEEISGQFYEPGVYYYHDDNVGIDKIDYSPTKQNYDYFTKEFAYVLNDEKGFLDIGAQWNSNIVTIPEHITLASRTQYWGWKELTDFGDKLNTINGLIVYINNLLKIDDIYTRDNKTVQGCINLMNDMINTFSTLLPGELMMVDEYGRIVSAPITITPDREEKYIDIQINKDSKDHGINIDYTALLQKIEELEARIKALEG